MNIKAVAYFRTSSPANVGEGKDTLPRQRDAVEAYAGTAGITLVRDFYDAGISGDTVLEQRPDYAEMLLFMESEGINTILVESADRWSRSVMVQELGVMLMQRVGVTVLTSSGQDLTEGNDENVIAMNQMHSVFAQMEKTRLVKKLRRARERIRADQGRCEGRLGFKHHAPEMVLLAKKMRRANPVTHRRMSYDKISQQLLQHGYTTSTGRVFNSNQVRRMCGGTG